MSSTSASISTPPSRDLNSATKKALFEEQVSFLLERQTYLYEELLDAFQVRYQYKNNGAFSDALIKSAMRILSGEADANVKKWAEEIISNTKSHLFTDWCKRRNKKPIEKEKVTRAGRQHINQVIVEVSKNFSAITGAIGSSARSQALGPTSSTNSVSSEAKDKRSHASSRLPEVESNRETDAIEGQRIPQLGRSRSMEEELEAEAADKLHGDVATDGHIAVLNQEPEWIVKGNDVLHLFQEFKKSELSQYSLSRDGIADITSRGDFISTLDDGDFNNIIDECSSLGQDDGIKPILSNLFTTAQSSFQDAIDESVKVDRSIPIVRSVAMALES
ncbi:hypothetical protein BGZ46_003069 [Entomortierella lignicola]|nr:hypothetical protein BGZ46_003069 [Entomortierella lignicola]